MRFGIGGIGGLSCTPGSSPYILIMLHPRYELVLGGNKEACPAGCDLFSLVAIVTSYKRPFMKLSANVRQRQNTTCPLVSSGVYGKCEAMTEVVMEQRKQICEYASYERVLLEVSMH